MFLQRIVALNLALRDCEIQHKMKSEVGRGKLRALYLTQGILLSFIMNSYKPILYLLNYSFSLLRRVGKIFAQTRTTRIVPIEPSTMEPTGPKTLRSPPIRTHLVHSKHL